MHNIKTIYDRNEELVGNDIYALVCAGRFLYRLRSSLTAKIENIRSKLKDKELELQLLRFDLKRLKQGYYPDIMTRNRVKEIEGEIEVAIWECRYTFGDMNQQVDRLQVVMDDYIKVRNDIRVLANEPDVTEDDYHVAVIFLENNEQFRRESMRS